LRRFFVEKIRENNGVCSITGSEAKHIAKVMRMKPGDRFVLLDGEGRRFQVSIKTVAPKVVQVVMEKSLSRPPHSLVNITLCQALLKSGAMDYLIQKTSELGVDRIVPFFSERTVVKYKKESFATKIRHWHEISVSSAKQSGGIPAEIETPVSIVQLNEEWKGASSALKVVLWEEEGTTDFKSLLKTCPPAEKILGMVGPEGGFSREEIDSCRDAGFVPVSLGHRILRAETAAMIMVAIVQYELGDLCL